MTDSRPEPGPSPASGSLPTADYPVEPASLPDSVIEAGSYLVRFARTPRDLDRILRLRYEVFNLELGEGLESSHQTGRDEDDLDARFHHLMIQSRRDDAVVGTYRMQTGEMARAYGGFYADQEFDLSSLPPGVAASAVEIGRACVARDHRNGRVLHLLWRGLARYLSWNRKAYLFGCCSINSQDPSLGLAIHRHLERIGAVHPTVAVRPREEHRCDLADRAALSRPPSPPPPSPEPHLPALFQTYLSLGALVCGPPAIDRGFRTIDWLVILHAPEIDPATHRTFFR